MKFIFLIICVVGISYISNSQNNVFLADTKVEVYATKRTSPINSVQWLSLDKPSVEKIDSLSISETYNMTANISYKQKNPIILTLNQRIATKDNPSPYRAESSNRPSVKYDTPVKIFQIKTVGADPKDSESNDNRN